MNYEYVCPKKKFQEKDIEKAQIFFRNGDFIQLTGSEIIDIDVSFYDVLTVGELGFCPVGKSGFIKCKICEKKPRYDSSLVFNKKEYSKNRKNYIEQRCLKEGGICYIRLFDKYFWHNGLYGNIIAYFDNGYLILVFQENKTYGPSNKDYHTVKARNVTKETVEKIYLDFENCDGFEIFHEEMQNIQINFEKELKWNSSCFGREVKNGFIRFKFDREITYRKADICGNTKKATIKNLEKRLCGKDINNIDICHLYVHYKDAGYGMQYPSFQSIENRKNQTIIALFVTLPPRKKVYLRQNKGFAYRWIERIPKEDFSPP